MQIRTPVRHRLLRRLEAGSGLTVVHAPTGSGKTTLLRAWSAERISRGLPVLWVNLTPETRTTQQVRDAVSAAVTETGLLEGLTGKRADTLRRLGDEIPAREALGTLFSVVPGLALVIDGGEHVTEDPDAMWAELFTLVRNHPNARAVLATRWLHRHRAELLALDPAVELIDDEMLAFRKEEVADVVGAAADSATDLELAERLTGETDGHPLAVMAGLVAGAGDPAAALTLWRRLVKDHTRADLERLGLLRVLEASASTPLTDATLTAALAGIDEVSAQAALQRTEANGYGHWRAAADGRTVFEIVPTARHALGVGTAPLDDPGMVVTWLVERDELGHALEMALRAELLERATGLYRRLLVTRPFDFTATFDLTLRTVPTDALLRHPMLAVARGVALLASPATQQEATPFLEPIAQRDPREVHEATPDDELMDLTAQSVVLGVLGRPGPSAAAGLEAARRLEDPDFAQRVDPQILTPLACMLSQTLMDAGHVGAAQRLISKGAAVASPELVHHTALYGRAWYGIDGRMAEARDMDTRVGQGTDLPEAEAAGVTWGPRTKAVEGLGAGLLLLDQWEFAAADAHVEAEQTPRWDPSRAWREWLRLHVALGRGVHDRAVRGVTVAWEEAGAQQSGLGASALANVMAVCWLATGNVSRAHQALGSATEHPGQTAPARMLAEIICAGPEAALHLATRLREEPGHTVRSRAAVETLAAAAALRTGGTQLAAQLLGDAAALHAEHGCRAHLLYLLSTDRAALLSLAGKDSSTAIQHYLAGLEVSSGLPDVGPQVSLSRRERAVLEALAAHGSRADMAHALHVSENTVKSQLRSIYRKLEVRHRAEAINRALELDLLREGAVRHL